MLRASRDAAPSQVAIELEDAALASALRLRLSLLAEFDEARRFEEADVIISDRPLADATRPVLVIGSDKRPGQGESVLRSIEPALVLSAAALVAAGHRIEPDSRGSGSDGAPVRLSGREQQVVELLVGGASNKVIARELGISVHTAKFHVAAVLDKLGARNRADAVAIALREGLVAV
jgi:DNA-binding NarL/FixJ family response regulator